MCFPILFISALINIMIQPHKFLSKVFKQATWEEDDSKNEVFITFDDGPIPEVTPWVLDEADKWNAKLTFFCVGDNVRKYPDVFNEVLKRGHAVGNHTFNHLRGWACNKETYFENVDKASEYIQSDYFRPPHGQIFPWYQDELKKRFKKIVMWSLLSYDYDPDRTGKQVFKTVEKRIKPGSVIVFHDSLKAQERMRYAFPKTLELIAQKGYKTQVFK